MPLMTASNYMEKIEPWKIMDLREHKIEKKNIKTQSTKWKRKKIESIIRKIEKKKIKNIIYETENTIKNAKNNAIKTKNSFWLSALEIFAEDIHIFSQNLENDNFSIKDAMTHILNLKEEAGVLSIPIEKEIPIEELTEETYYNILDVSSKVKQEEIKKAYRKRTKEFHPDRILSRWDKADETPDWIKIKVDKMSRDLNEAYVVLNNPDRRREYDIKIGVCP